MIRFRALDGEIRVREGGVVVWEEPIRGATETQVMLCWRDMARLRAAIDRGAVVERVLQADPCARWALTWRLADLEIR